MASPHARSLRTNSTDAERKLWYWLRQRRIDGFRFRRQHPIGPYIVDFACLSEKLVVEADGGQHAENTERDDEERTAWLEWRGYRVIRFWNNDIHANIEGVFETIQRALRGESDSVEQFPD